MPHIPFKYLREPLMFVVFLSKQLHHNQIWTPCQMLNVRFSYPPYESKSIQLRKEIWYHPFTRDKFFNWKLMCWRYLRTCLRPCEYATLRLCVNLDARYRRYVQLKGIYFLEFRNQVSSINSTLSLTKSLQMSWNWQQSCQGLNSWPLVL